MDLNKIMPNGDSWSFSKGIIYFKKIQKILICILIDDVPHIILENKIPKRVLELTKNFMKSGQEFYFTTPLATNPSGVIDFKNEVIRSYLYSYANTKFFVGFKKFILATDIVLILSSGAPPTASLVLGNSSASKLAYITNFS